MSSRRTITRLAAGIACVIGLAGTASAADTSYGPTPYVKAADSPFSSGIFSYFYLETFEDHLLNTPGVTASAGGVTSVVFGPSIHDSVDADDGNIDGSGLAGDSFFSGSGGTGIKFSFNAGVLGTLPTSAGVVWTDGGGDVTFRAYGPANVLLYETTLSGIPDASFNGETGEDRFFGYSSDSGISAIFLSNTGGGIEVDHLQYGAAGVVVGVPEPSTYALMLVGLGVVGFMGRRRKA